MATLPSSGAVSIDQIRVAVNANRPVGMDQSWQNMTSVRTHSVSYQNNTGRPIMLAVMFTSEYAYLQVSSDNANWVNVGNGAFSGEGYAIVPPNHYYRLSTTTPITFWSELR